MLTEFLFLVLCYRTTLAVPGSLGMVVSAVLQFFDVFVLYQVKVVTSIPFRLRISAGTTGTGTGTQV